MIHMTFTKIMHIQRQCERNKTKHSFIEQYKDFDRDKELVL